MFPDLGKYALPVLGSYAVTAALLLALIGASLITRRHVKRDLAEVEARMERQLARARQELNDE